MNLSKPAPKTVDEYLYNFPEAVQYLLEELRETIKQAAPEAVEVISYQMPAYLQEGKLVYFAAYKNHIGFYPTPSGIAAFKDELAAFNCSKGTVQFPIDKPLPLDLIARIVMFRVSENLDKAKAKSRG